MRLVKNNVVECHDGNTYAIGERTNDNYVMGKDPTTGNQRLFKPNGHYAGGDKAKNVARVL